MVVFGRPCKKFISIDCNFANYLTIKDELYLLEARVSEKLYYSTYLM